MKINKNKGKYKSFIMYVAVHEMVRHHGFNIAIAILNVTTNSKITRPYKKYNNLRTFYVDNVLVTKTARSACITVANKISHNCKSLINVHHRFDLAQRRNSIRSCIQVLQRSFILHEPRHSERHQHQLRR